MTFLRWLWCDGWLKVPVIRREFDIFGLLVIGVALVIVRWLV